jgi:hypothetical protein
MRPFVLLLLCALVAPSVLSSQQPAPHPALVDDVPEGTNWIANASTHLYYPVGCPITVSIPAADKLYYKSEASLQTAGFTKSTECDSSRPTNPPATTAPALPVPSATSATPAPAPAGEKSAQQKNRRSGFWFNGGFGYGSFGCQGCDGRVGSLSGGIALGGSVSQKVLLGAATTGWAKSENGTELDVGTLVAVIRFYPSATGAFFLLGGLGVGSIHGESSEFGIGSQTETGFGALLGLGYDIRVGSNVSLTPFWNGFAVNTDTDDANVGQIGLGLTIH